MQGIFIGGRRPKSKKEVKEVALTNPEKISIEATSFFGNEYDGSLLDMPDGTVTFVGPDPYTLRNFYGTLAKKGDKITVK